MEKAFLAGEFARKLRRLNSNLRIWCGDDDRRPAGLFHIVNGEYEDICGVDKHIVPEWPIFEANGRIRKSGWRRVLGILRHKKLVSDRDISRVFKTKLYSDNERLRPNIQKTAVQEAILNGLSGRRDDKNSPIYTRDEVHDIATEMRKESKNG